MITRIFILFAVLLTAGIFACSDDEDSGPLVGTWKGINPVGGSSIYGENTAVFATTTFTFEVQLTNTEKTLVTALEGSYAIETTNLVVSVTKEYQLTNQVPPSGYWTNYALPDVRIMPFSIEGSRLTLTTPGGILALDKQ